MYLGTVIVRQGNDGSKTDFILHHMGCQYEELCFVTGHIRKLFEGLLRNKDPTKGAKKKAFSEENQASMMEIVEKVESNNDKLDLNLQGRILSFMYVIKRFDGMIIGDALRHNKPYPSHTQQVIKMLVAHSLGPITYKGGPFALAFAYVALASGCDLNAQIPQLIIELSLIPESSYIEEIRQLFSQNEIYTETDITSWKTVDDNVLDAWNLFELKVLEFGSVNSVVIQQTHGKNKIFFL